MLPISAKTFAGLARPADAMRGMHAQFGDGPDVVAKRVATQAKPELQLRGEIDKHLDATSGVQYLIRPRNERGEFTKGAPMQFEAAEAKFRQVLEGARQLGDAKMIKSAEDGVAEAAKGAAAQQAGKGAGDHSNKLFNIADAMRAINGADSLALRGTPTGPMRPRNTEHLAHSETAAELDARAVPGSFTYDANGEVVARKSYSDAAMKGREMRARRGDSETALLGNSSEALARIRAARGADVNAQQIQSAQQ